MSAEPKPEFIRSIRSEPGPRDRILDLFGSFIRDFGGWIAVADLLVLLESLGVGEASGRSALSRMKRQGEIVATKRGVARGYALTESSEEWFVDGTARILAGPRSDCLLYTSPSPRDQRGSRMPSSA